MNEFSRSNSQRTYADIGGRYLLKPINPAWSLLDVIQVAGRFLERKALSGTRCVICSHAFDAVSTRSYSYPSLSGKSCATLCKVFCFFFIKKNLTSKASFIQRDCFMACHVFHVALVHAERNVRRNAGELTAVSWTTAFACYEESWSWWYKVTYTRAGDPHLAGSCNPPKTLPIDEFREHWTNPLTWYKRSGTTKSGVIWMDNDFASRRDQKVTEGIGSIHPSQASRPVIPNPG